MVLFVRLYPNLCVNRCADSSTFVLLWFTHLSVSSYKQTLPASATTPLLFASTMDTSSLQIPDSSIPGPSRQYGASRPVSVSVHPTTNSPSQASGRKRASHAVVSSQQQQQQQMDDQPSYHDVYSHPAAVAYAAAHPRRTIPKFGPYLLLQTLGEGEFGKVKLGLHSQWGEEVAVKLIRRGNIDTTIRMSKVEREIEVLRVCTLFSFLGSSHELRTLIDPQTSKHCPSLRCDRNR